MTLKARVMGRRGGGELTTKAMRGVIRVRMMMKMMMMILMVMVVMTVREEGYVGG